MIKQIISGLVNLLLSEVGELGVLGEPLYLPCELVLRARKEQLKGFEGPLSESLSSVE